MQQGSGEARPIQGLGLWTVTALAAGNMIGSGIFVVPGTVAELAGPLSLAAWVVNAIGYLCLTAVFADLGGAYPVSGGPQVFVQRAFGDLAGFQASALYWFSSVITNTAFVTGFVGYLAVFFPEIGSPWPAFITAQALLWGFTGLNLIGVAASGDTGLAMTALKIVPLLVLSGALLFSGSVENLQPVAPHGYLPLITSISFVSWLFQGTESITVPADEVKGSGAVIRRSAYMGYTIAACLYMLVAFSMMYGFPWNQLNGSASPLAVAANRVLGPWGQAFITIGALISIGGALNGWLLVAGRLPYAAAREGLAPAWLGKLSPRTGAPVNALIVSTAISAVMLLQFFDRTLLKAYEFIVLASTATALLAIGGCCLAQFVLIHREPEQFTARQRGRAPFTAGLGFAVVVLMIYGCGWEVIRDTAGVVVVFVPAYYLLRRRK